MEILIKSLKPEWDGMSYIAIYADFDKIKSIGLGHVKNNFKDAYVLLKNLKSGKECAAIVKTMVHSNSDFIEIDSCLAFDLTSLGGSSIDISPLNPVNASLIRVAISKPEYNLQDVQNSCNTYLTRHCLSIGQTKPVYFLSGDKIIIEVLDVKPEKHSVFSPNTEIVLDTDKIASAFVTLDDVGGLENEKKIIRERILLPILQPDFFSSHGIKPPRGILLCGPPGCGKTMIARALSSEIKANFVELTGSEIFNPYYGESEKVIKEKFNKAREKTRLNHFLRCYEK